MKNLFNFATKELSQDAFLRWLFENYNCENESVRLACRCLFNAFTSVSDIPTLHFDEITKLETFSQWKNIDITIEFEIGKAKYLICIEDKTSSDEHNQLATYNKHIDKCRSNFTHVFKIFYKTNIIDSAERQRVETQGWHIYDIFDISSLFADIKATSEVLAYYIESINSIRDSVNRTTSPKEWSLTAWHSFFNDYKPLPSISQHKEIACYQKAYYYMKLFTNNHLTDMPCLEIRSRDFSRIDDKHTITARVVLYNYKGAVNSEMINEWQVAMCKKMPNFISSHRADVSSHKQIGKIIMDVNNTEQDLIYALDEMSKVLL